MLGDCCIMFLGKYMVTLIGILSVDGLFGWIGFLTLELPVHWFLNIPCVVVLCCCFDLDSISCYLFRKLLPYFNLVKNILGILYYVKVIKGSEIWRFLTWRSSWAGGLSACGCITYSTRTKIF